MSMTPTQPAPLDDAGALATLAACEAYIDKTDRFHYRPGEGSPLAEHRKARAHLAARLAAQTKMLADCFRAAGADCDGNEDWRIADRAYQAVCDLREDYNEACEELHGENGWVKRATRAEAELAAARKLPAMILHDSWAGTASRLEAWAKQRSYQNLAGQTMEEAAAFIRHYLDAARGEGG